MGVISFLTLSLDKCAVEKKFEFVRLIYES